MSATTLGQLALLALTIFAPPLRAEQQALHCPTCRDCGACEVCCPTIEKVTEEETEWKVECEKKCIPAIRLPWEPGGSKLTLFSWWAQTCDHGNCACASAADAERSGAACNQCAKCAPVRCGAVRPVSILSEESREVTVSKCKWEIRRLPWRITPDRHSLGCGCPAPLSPPNDETTGALPLPSE